MGGPEDGKQNSGAGADRWNEECAAGAGTLRLNSQINPKEKAGEGDDPFDPKAPRIGGVLDTPIEPPSGDEEAGQSHQK